MCNCGDWRGLAWRRAGAAGTVVCRQSRGVEKSVKGCSKAVKCEGCVVRV